MARFLLFREYNNFFAPDIILLSLPANMKGKVYINLSHKNLHLKMDFYELKIIL